MFGGLVIPINSPHLRKSGSRPVVSDLDANEVENGVDDGLLQSTEANDLKGATLPISAPAIMPSPMLLWRFKVLLFLVWGFICCKFGWDSVMRMSADKRDLFLYEAFLYYNPLLLATLMVWLWGINLWFFAHGSVNYVKIFDLDQNHLTHREIWKVTAISTLTHITFGNWCQFLQNWKGTRNGGGISWNGTTISALVFGLLTNVFVLLFLSTLFVCLAPEISIEQTLNIITNKDKTGSKTNMNPIFQGMTTPTSLGGNRIPILVG